MVECPRCHRPLKLKTLPDYSKRTHRIRMWYVGASCQCLQILPRGKLVVYRYSAYVRTLTEARVLLVRMLLGDTTALRPDGGNQLWRATESCWTEDATDYGDEDPDTEADPVDS